MNKNIELIPVVDIAERDHPHFPFKLSDTLKKDPTVRRRLGQFEVRNALSERINLRYQQLTEGCHGDQGFVVMRVRKDAEREPIGIGSLTTRELHKKTGGWFSTAEQLGSFTLINVVVIGADEYSQPTFDALKKEAENGARGNLAILEPAVSDIPAVLQAAELEIIANGKIGGSGIPRSESFLYKI